MQVNRRFYQADVSPCSESRARILKVSIFVPRWIFSCGSSLNDDICFKSCESTGWVNTYDGYFAWTAPENHVVIGVSSIHDNGAE